MDNHELYHHGIKGMKWGVRRFQKKNGSLTPAGKKRQKEKWSEDATEASKIKKKSVKEMSNAELKRLNERTRLEQEYARLNPSTRKKAIAAATATAATMGTLLNLYNNSDKIIAKSKPIVDKLLKPAAKKARNAMAVGMWSDIHSDELYHYGVKGMKWGVRRTAEELGYKSNKDVDRLNEEWGKLAKAKSEMLDTQKTQYVRGGAGNPIIIYNVKKQKAYEQQKKVTQDLVNKLEKSGYKVTNLDNDWDEDGYMYTTTFLEKNGTTYASERYNGRYH